MHRNQGEGSSLALETRPLLLPYPSGTDSWETPSLGAGDLPGGGRWRRKDLHQPGILGGRDPAKRSSLVVRIHGKGPIPHLR